MPPQLKFDPVDFYRRALLWRARASDEVALRSAASRAYYGAFLQARELLTPVEKAKLKKSGADHGYVANCYLNRTTPIELQIGNELRALRILRNQADYDLQPAFLTFKAGQALNLALSILTNLGVSP